MKNIFFTGLTLLICASPSSAADLQDWHTSADTRRAAFAGAFFQIPFEGRKAVSGTSVGMRLSAVHYRHSSVDRRSEQVSSEILKLNFSSPGKPSLHLAGTAVTGEESRKLKALGTGETIALVVGGVVLVAIVGREILGKALSGD